MRKISPSVCYRFRPPTKKCPRDRPTTLFGCLQGTVGVGHASVFRHVKRPRGHGDGHEDRRRFVREGDGQDQDSCVGFGDRVRDPRPAGASDRVSWLVCSVRACVPFAHYAWVFMFHMHASLSSFNIYIAWPPFSYRLVDPAGRPLTSRKSASVHLKVRHGVVRGSAGGRVCVRQARPDRPHQERIHGYLVHRARAAHAARRAGDVLLVVAALLFLARYKYMSYQHTRSRHRSPLSECR